MTKERLHWNSLGAVRTSPVTDLCTLESHQCFLARRFGSVVCHALPVNIPLYICNKQINACTVIGQSAMGYYAGKPTEKSCVF